MKKEGSRSQEPQIITKKGLPTRIKLYYRQQKPGQAMAGKQEVFQEEAETGAAEDPLKSHSPASFTTLSTTSSPLMGFEDGDKAKMPPYTATTSSSTTTLSVNEDKEALSRLGALISRFCVERNISPQLIDHLEGLIVHQLKRKDRVKEFTVFLCTLLEAVIYNEAKRLSLKKSDAEIDFSDWLGHLEFTSALFSAALISFYGHEMDVINGNGSAFELLMVLETVIRCGVLDSKAIKRLQDLERCLLEEAVWNDLQLYQMLQIESNNRRKAMQTGLMESPRKAIQSMTGNDCPSTGGGLTRLELFFRKYFRLVVSKIDKLTERLGLSPSIFPTALWSAFIGLVEAEPSLSILRHRHLDQILAALTYSVCKFYDHGRSFKEIIAAMQPIPEALYKAIWMGEGRPRADLVAFYNLAFLPVMRGVIHSLPPIEELDESAAGKEDEDQVTVPKTPQQKGRQRANSFTEWAIGGVAGSPSRVHLIPSAHSPISASSHLTKRVQFSVSPMKHHLSRTIPHTMTPTKLHITTASSSDLKTQPPPPTVSDADTLINVARRLEF